MSCDVLAKAERGQNRVVLIVLLDESLGMRNPPLFLVTFYIATNKGPQHWARSVADPQEARELYDQCVLDHVTPEPSFHGEHV